MAPKPVQVSQFGPDSTAEDYYNALEYSTLFELERSFFRAAPDVTWDRYGVEALAFEGGGTKGVAYGGALRRLEKTGILANIKYLSGTSAGAQTAALVAVGYSADEVIKVLADAPWTELFDDSYGCFRDLYRLNTGFGIYKGDFLEKYLDGLFEAKLGIKNITLGQLYARTGVHIKLGVISVKERAFVMLDYTNEPSMPLALAARASSALPGIFTAVEWRDNRYVDGGLLGNLPSEAFPGMKLLGLDLTSEEDYQLATNKLINIPTGMVAHFSSLMNLVLNNAQKSRDQVNRASMSDSCQWGLKHNSLVNRLRGKPPANLLDIVKIPTGTAPTLDTKLEQDEIDILVAAGWVAIDKYLTGAIDLDFRRTSTMKELLATGSPPPLKEPVKAKLAKAKHVKAVKA